jgi:hypothetical protein
VRYCNVRYAKNKQHLFMECNKDVKMNSIFFAVKNVIKVKNVYVLHNDEFAPSGRSFFHKLKPNKTNEHCE